MKLGEFIKNFSHNNMIRLLYKDGGGHILVEEDWNKVSMDWEVNKGKGVFRHYIDNNVVGIVGIYGIKGAYQDAINIVIERMDNQPFLEEFNEDKSSYEQCVR